MSGPAFISDSEITEAMREYLRHIYELSQAEEWVTNVAVAERLGVSGTASIQMAHRLHNAGLVNYFPYRGIQLAAAGQLVALRAIRRVRLAECFLVDVLKFHPNEVKPLAGCFCRGMSQIVEDRIDELTCFPSHCPHGQPIPSRDSLRLSSTQQDRPGF